LDDGTDLNKYSTALAKAGISIKDTSGELKNMDVILNEMGESWSGLERDEKMALAQTVAGVRQYTQLMTLMENWDTFK
jgi:TP901 family phage tail tape measure protein